MVVPNIKFDFENENSDHSESCDKIQWRTEEGEKKLKTRKKKTKA